MEAYMFWLSQKVFQLVVLTALEGRTLAKIDRKMIKQKQANPEKEK